MDIQTFFQQSVGKWVSQRTSHRLAQNQSEGAKADLIMEMLGQDDPALVQLCQQQGGDPEQAYGLKITWTNGIVDRNPKPQSGTSLLVALPDALQGSNQGQMISRINSAAPVVGRYAIGEDQVLTLITEAGERHVEERIWFASENFRLRTGVVSCNGNTDLATFCSEIRMGGAPPAQQTTAVEAAN